MIEKAAVLIGCAIAGGIVGFLSPMFFSDRNVGGALASALLGIAGLPVGAIIGMIIIRRRF